MKRDNQRPKPPAKSESNDRHSWFATGMIPLLAFT